MNQPVTSADHLVRWRYRTAVQAALVLNRVSAAPSPRTSTSPPEAPPEAPPVPREAGPVDRGPLAVRT